MPKAAGIREQIKKNWLGIFALVMSIFNFVWIIVTHNPPPDVHKVINVLEKEAEAARAHDVALACSLYDEQATVRDIYNRITWSGRERIKKRYEELPEFLELAHVGAAVTFDQSGTYARVKAGTDGLIKRDGGIREPIHSVDGEEWTLRKKNGVWRISDFTYGLRP